MAFYCFFLFIQSEKEAFLVPVEMLSIEQRILNTRSLIDFSGIENHTRVNVDCSKMSVLIIKAGQEDQELRMTGYGADDTDERNQALLVSLMEDCDLSIGFTWDNQNAYGFFIILQHAPFDLQAYYYPIVRILALKGFLDAPLFAMYQDRQLVRGGYKQVFGTQFNLMNELFDMEYPATVNQRRVNAGLGTIERALWHRNLVFEDELKRLQTVD